MNARNAPRKLVGTAVLTVASILSVFGAVSILCFLVYGGILVANWTLGEDGVGGLVACILLVFGLVVGGASGLLFPAGRKLRTSGVHTTEV